MCGIIVLELKNVASRNFFEFYFMEDSEGSGTHPQKRVSGWWSSPEMAPAFSNSGCKYHVFLTACVSCIIKIFGSCLLNSKEF